MFMKEKISSVIPLRIPLPNVPTFVENKPIDVIYWVLLNHE